MFLWTLLHRTVSKDFLGSKRSTVIFIEKTKVGKLFNIQFVAAGKTPVGTLGLITWGGKDLEILSQKNLNILDKVYVHKAPNLRTFLKTSRLGARAWICAGQNFFYIFLICNTFILAKISQKSWRNYFSVKFIYLKLFAIGYLE